MSSNYSSANSVSQGGQNPQPLNIQHAPVNQQQQLYNNNINRANVDHGQNRPINQTFPNIHSQQSQSFVQPMPQNIDQNQLNNSQSNSDQDMSMQVSYSQNTQNSENPKDWMSRCPKPLEKLHILGTHSSGNFAGEGRTQTLDIQRQLEAGVRFIDLILVQYMNEIFISQYEDIYDFKKCYVTLSEVIWNIKYFLSVYKNEVVFISLNSIKTEKSDSISNLLLEIKFKPIENLIFNASELNLALPASNLTNSTKKNIILFAPEDLLFTWLFADHKVIPLSKINVTKVIDENMHLKAIWGHVHDHHPRNLMFYWLLLDQTDPERDSKELKGIWTEQYNHRVTTPFSIFTLSHVGKYTFNEFSSLMQYA